MVSKLVLKITITRAHYIYSMASKIDETRDDDADFLIFISVSVNKGPEMRVY